MMTYQQALDQAVKLRNQGLTYKQIEDHLKSAGYVSSRTKQPVKEMAIRYMVTKEEESIKKASSETQDEKPMFVTAGTQSVEEFKKELRVLLGVKELSRETKEKILEVVLAPKEAELKSAPRAEKRPAQVQQAAAQ